MVRESKTLKMGFRPGRAHSLREPNLEAKVAMPELAGLALSGGSDATITGFKPAKALGVDLSGGSHLRGDIEAGDATFDLSGSSDVTLGGSAGDLTIDASGGSHVRLADLSVVDANFDASAGSDVTVNPSGRLDVDATGHSHVTYLGSPTLGAIDTSACSTVERE